MKAIDAIARTVLYEGLRLYPYRETSLKNQRCFLIGTIPPGGDAHTECLVLDAKDNASFAITVRFIDIPNAKERVITLPPLRLEQQIEHPIDVAPFHGRVIARSQGDVVLVTIENHSSGDHGLGAAHVVLSATNARFVALSELPLHVQQAQRGLWPILIDDHHVLASPIILSDRPTIAPESQAGDLMDATEIEEILSLRIRTLTAEEQVEARKSDVTRAIVDRALALTPEQLDRLHGGTFRSEFAVGDRVILRPHAARRADALDLLLKGMEATVAAIETTDLGEAMYSVTIDKDPGKDLGERGFPGHRFFFRGDEMEKRSR
jgi:hypothetical protein